MNDLLVKLMNGPLLHPRKSRALGRKKASPNGYPAMPGTGPAGKTCGDCAHDRRVQGGNRAYHKCAILEFRWTRGPGTDIKKKSPACALFNPKSP